MQKQMKGQLLACGLLFLATVFGICPRAKAQDTLRLNEEMAEARFLKQNLLLLAEQLNISKAEAEVLQAKAWPNPSFTFSDVQLSSAKETETAPGLLGTRFWENRNFSAEFEQLVLLAGKRKKNVDLQKQNRETARLEFLDFLNRLKAEFRKHLAELDYLQNVSGDLLFQKQFVDQLILVQERQYREGIISKSQFFRIKSLQLSVATEIKELNAQVSEVQQSLKNWMAIPSGQYLVVEAPAQTEEMRLWKNRTAESLIARAQKNSTVALVAESLVKSSDLALRLEKANAVPDLNLQLSYERVGNMHLNYVGAGISMDLPLFNRNKGNIKRASLEVQQMQIQRDYAALELANAVAKMNNDLQQSIQLFESIDPAYLSDLEEMTESLTENFLKKNISLLEFMDFFDAFKESKERYYDVLRDFRQQKEELLYLIGDEPN